MSLEIESLESQNHHPSSTAKNETRYQLWMERMINKKLGEQREVRTFLSNNDINENKEFFGVDAVV